MLFVLLYSVSFVSSIYLSIFGVCSFLLFFRKQTIAYPSPMAIMAREKMDGIKIL